MAPDEMATHLEMNPTRLHSEDDMKWEIAKYIARASLQEHVRMHVGHVEEWGAEMYGDGVGAIGLATAMARRAT